MSHSPRVALCVLLGNVLLYRLHITTGSSFALLHYSQPVSKAWTWRNAAWKSKEYFLIKIMHFYIRWMLGHNLGSSFRVAGKDMSSRGSFQKRWASFIRTTRPITKGNIGQQLGSCSDVMLTPCVDKARLDPVDVQEKGHKPQEDCREDMFLVNKFCQNTGLLTGWSAEACSKGTTRYAITSDTKFLLASSSRKLMFVVPCINHLITVN